MSQTADKERTPASSLFHERLVACNGLEQSGFKEWLFYPGMLFGSLCQWWGGRRNRNRRHEGLDLRCYRTEAGDVQQIRELKIPAAFGGTVQRVIDDFLGKSVFLCHDVRDEQYRRLYTIYGHVQPCGHVYPGNRLDGGEVMGVIPENSGSAAETPSHLHVSAAWIPDTVNPQEIDWKTVNASAEILLVDPLRVIAIRYSIIQG